MHRRSLASRSLDAFYAPVEDEAQLAKLTVSVRTFSRE